MNVERATAILIANLKGSKKKPSGLFDISKATRTMISEWSIKRCSDFFKVSEYQLRQFDKLNDLEPAVQDIIKKNKLGIETAYLISRLDAKIQEKAVKSIQGLRSHEVRQFIHLIKQNPKMSLTNAKKTVQKSLRENSQIIVLPLSLQTFTDLQEKSKKHKKKIHDYLLQIIEDELYEKK